MKKLLVMIMMFGFIQGCSYSSVDAGEEAVLTYKPWIFGHGGVDNVALTTGAIWTVWSTSVDRYNIKPVKVTEKFIDLTASDNVAIDFNSYITLQVEKGKSPVLHELSGRQWYKNKVQDVYRTIVRNEARTRSSIELRTKPDIISSSQQVILEKIKQHIERENLPVIVSKIIIGKVVPPAEVLVEAERTAAQKQRVKTQRARKLAEDSRKAAEKSKALADKAYANQFKMTTEQFLRNKELDIISEKENVSIIMGNAQPIFKVK